MRHFSSAELFEEFLLRALGLEIAYSDSRGIARDGTPAAVLLLFGFHEGNDRQPVGDPALLLTKRTETVKTHKGQMAFPGGTVDSLDQSPVATALRETFEEVGILENRIRVLGHLPPLFTATGFRVDPVIGILKQPIEQITLLHNDAEIAETLWVPLSVLEREGTYRREALTVGALRYPIHVYQVESYRIWGATASMIKNLLDRFQSV